MLRVVSLISSFHITSSIKSATLLFMLTASRLLLILQEGLCDIRYMVVASNPKRSGGPRGHEHCPAPGIRFCCSACASVSMLQSGGVGRYSSLGFICCLRGGFVFRCFGALGFNLSSAKGGVLVLRSASVGTECFAFLLLVVGLLGFLGSSVGTERFSFGMEDLLLVLVLSVGTERH